MTGHTISGTYTTGYDLTNTANNPLDILSAGSITLASTSAAAFQAAAGTYWTIANAGKITGNYIGVSLAGSGTLVNTGHITASQTTAAVTGGHGYSYNSASHSFTPLSGGVLLAGGGVSNASGAVITGYFEGVAFTGSGTVTNSGTIHGTGTGSLGVVLTAGGSVSNGSTGITGTITAGRFGILSFGTTAATVTNRGLISGQTADGVDLGGGGTVTNLTGTITGGSYGVVLVNGGSISNSSAAVIKGGRFGVIATDAAATLTNQGTIAGTTASGAYFLDGGYVNNAKTGTITGSYFGIQINSISSSVTNFGSVSSSRSYTGPGFDAAGVDLEAGGTVTNGVSGNIRATWKGVEIGSTAASVGGTVFNQGTIYASNSGGSTGAAVWIHGPAQISNAVSGTIAGGPFAIVTYFQTTVTNYGTISGTEFAVDNTTAGFADRVIDEPGASFVGIVTGGNTIGSSIVSTLELASTSLQGTLTGLGLQFIDFAQTTIDAGAAWTFSGSNTLASGATLTDRGTMVLSSGTFSGAGIATIADAAGNFADATITGAGAVWSGPANLVIGDQGNGSLLVSNQGTVQTDGTAATQGFDLAQSAGGTGDATVTGSKSLLNNTGRFVVGDAGLGTLAIEAGGTVITTPGTIAGLAGAVIGAQSGSDGSGASITGNGSDWQISGLLAVGDNAAGSLEITAGGTATAGQLDSGVLTGSSGIISVIGTGSALTLSGQLTIGDAASAELSILSGGTVNANNADIGLNANGTGNVDIEDSGSELNINNNLNIGDAGVGVLTLGNNTTLAVGNNINVGANGILNQLGGSIDPSTITIAPSGRQGGHGSTTASVEISNAGTLYASSGTETVNTPLITAPSGKTGILEIDTNGDLVLNVTSVDATQSVNFTDSTGILTLGTIGGFGGTIATVNAGDQIIVQGTSIASDSYSATNDVLTLFNGSSGTIGTLQLAASVDGFALLPNGSGGITVAPCFVAGTRISTERGEIAVEDLREGDRVQIARMATATPPPNPLPQGAGETRTCIYSPAPCGRGLGGGVAAQPIIWIGHRTIDCTRHPKPHQVWPVRLSAHAFGPNRPSRDLYLSPDHAVYIGDALIPIKHLINGTTITQVPRTSVTYYHIELPEHSVLLAENLPAESYLDIGDRSHFANGGSPIVLYPDFASRIWESAGCAPLIVAGPKLDAVRQWLDAIAINTVRTTDQPTSKQLDAPAPSTRHGRA
jgi:T5SS/PEP-CTERM-associated repeat protein